MDNLKGALFFLTFSLGCHTSISIFIDFVFEFDFTELVLDAMLAPAHVSHLALLEDNQRSFILEFSM